MKIRIDYLLMRILFGPRWKEKLWMSKQDKRALENQILISTAPILAEKWGLKPITVNIDAEYPCFNPSIIKSASGYKLIARSSNLVNLNDGHYFYKSRPHKTINYILQLDENFNVLSQSKLDDSLVSKSGMVAELGIEDARLFYWKKSIWICGAGLHFLNKANEIGVQQILCKLDGNTLIDYKVLDSPYGRKVEKNWVPIVQGDELTFAYSLSPIELIRFNNGLLEHKKIANKNEDDFRIRGGTPFVRWKNQFLGVVHSAHIHHQGKRYYVHHFITLNNELEILEVSEPFFIQRRGTEFASGLELDDDGVILSFGLADRACKVMKVPNAIIERYIIW
jgi:hypothetical protein